MQSYFNRTTFNTRQQNRKCEKIWTLPRWIPPPRVLHPYPDARFYATHPS